MAPYLTMGTSENAQLNFVGKTVHFGQYGGGSYKVLEIHLQSGDNQDFSVSTSIRGVSVSDIDQLIGMLQKAKEFDVQERIGT